MILKEVNEEDGERTKAANFFNDNAVTVRTRNWLMNSTVLLKRNDGRAKASGVILDVNQTATNDNPRKTYILTAKHVLYKLYAEENYGENEKPADYADDTLLSNIQVYYEPDGLLTEPQHAAPVTGFNFTGSTDQDWLYDIVIFESTDNNFCDFAYGMVFVDNAVKNTYTDLLMIKNNGCDILRTRDYEFFQLGYGEGRDGKEATRGQNYQDYPGKIQCKISRPSATEPGDGFFDIDTDLTADKWPINNQICLMDADITNSSGPGDSGGPLFCRLKTDKNKFYLVGVTTGANLFADNDLKEENADLTDHLTIIMNNAVTYWKELFDAWEWRN